MKHAFLIEAHTDPDLLCWLTDRLDYGDIYIHVDAKNDALYQMICSYTAGRDNVHVLSDRLVVNWSGLSIVAATLALLEAAVGRADYDYIHLISGQDLPLHDQAGVEAWICSHGKGRDFVEFEKAGHLSWRLQHYSLFREDPRNRKPLFRMMDIALRLVQLPLPCRKQFARKTIWKGSAWFSITGKTAEALVQMAQEEDLLETWKYTACPDEHFVQMLLLESPLKDNLVNCSGRYLEWSGASPRYLNAEDIARLDASKYLFARKITSKADDSPIRDAKFSSNTIK